MLRRRPFIPIAVVLVAVLASGLFAASALANGTVNWTGHGTDSVKPCKKGESPYLHWIFTTGGKSAVSAATLTLGGSGSGSYAMSNHGGSWTVDTNYYDLTTLTASVAYTGSLGKGTSNLNISDGCSGPTTPPPPPPATVSLGYVDNFANHGTVAGIPWDASNLGYTPTYVIGCGVNPNGGGPATDVCPQLPAGYGTGDEYDGGAILIVNSSATDPMSVTGASVTIGGPSCTYNPWPGLNITLSPGQSLVLTQTGGPDPCTSGTPVNPDQFNFDTSESYPSPISCTVSDGLIPAVSLTLDGTPVTINDAGQILNTGGVDPGNCGDDEYHSFVQVSP